MKPEVRDFLNLRRLPGILDVEQVAALLGTVPASIPILVAKKFLSPLGQGIKKTAPKHFSSTVVVALANDPDAMNRMQNILTTHYRVRNGTGVPRLKSVA